MKTQERLQDIMEKPMIKPQLDFLLVELVPRDSNIVMIDNKPDNADVFLVKDVGPGYWQDGTFIAPHIKKGDKVFIVGNLFGLKYKGVFYNLARCREVIAVVD